MSQPSHYLEYHFPSLLLFADDKGNIYITTTAATFCKGCNQGKEDTFISINSYSYTIGIKIILLHRKIIYMKILSDRFSLFDDNIHRI